MTGFRQHGSDEAIGPAERMSRTAGLGGMPCGEYDPPTMASHSGESAKIRYAVDEHPPHLLAAGLGFQVVVLILAGIVLTPLIVLRSAGTGEEYTSWVVFAALCVCGITTIIQARPIGPIGAGYVLYMGTSGAFLAVSVTAVKLGGISLLATLVTVAALFQFAFASRLALLRKIITPAVGGTVIMLIAVTVFPLIFKMLTDVPEGVDAGAAEEQACSTQNRPGRIAFLERTTLLDRKIQ